MIPRASWLTAVAIAFTWAGIVAGEPLRPLERMAYDWHMRLQPDPPVLPEILVVAIDEPSLDTLAWPWGRDVQAQIIDRLGGARAVLLDVLLSDAGRSFQDDSALAAALKRHGRVFLAVAADPDNGHRAVIPDANFWGMAKGYGSIRVAPDDDAILRRTRLFFPIASESDIAAGMTVPDDDSQAAAAAIGSDSVALMSLQIAQLVRPALTLPPSGEVLPNFANDPNAFPQVSAIDVINNKVPPARFKDKIVLVGATAQGLNDFHILPVGVRFGILYQAQVISSLVRQDWRQPLPGWLPPILTGIAVLTALLAWEALPALFAGLLILGGMGVLLAVDWQTWRHGSTWLPTASMLVAVLVSLLGLGLGRQIVLARQLRGVVRHLVSAFQQRDVQFNTQAHLTHQSQRQPLSAQIQALVTIAEAFHAEWRFLQALIETNRDPVLVVDSERRIILSNSAGTALFGDKAVGAHLQSLLGTMLDADGQAELEATWESVQTGRIDVTPPLIQHGLQALEVNFLPMAGGRGTLCLFEDVTSLHRRANTDGLTGLWNRRYFDEKLATEIARFQRYGHDHPVGLILIDVDHFKKVNDTHGHQIGDLVLKLIAALIQDKVRATDLPVRYGGEEMCVLLSHTDLAGSLILAERLREGIGRLQPEDANGRPFTVTASFGVSVSAAGDTSESLIGRADLALYKSKEQGRNRVTAGEAAEGQTDHVAHP
jgi:diguanylate cyclase (GGDEF)-like protein